MNHLALNKLYLPIALIFVLYHVSPGYVDKRYDIFEAEQHLMMTNRLFQREDWEWAFPMKRGKKRMRYKVQKVLYEWDTGFNFRMDQIKEMKVIDALAKIPGFIQLYSHAYGFEYIRPNTWVNGWFTDWMIDNFYSLIYMVPAPRKWKTGEQTLVRWMANFRYHRGLIRNNIVTGWYLMKLKQRFAIPHFHFTRYQMPIKVAVLGAAIFFVLTVPELEVLKLLGVIGAIYVGPGGSDSASAVDHANRWVSMDNFDEATGYNNETIYLERGGTYSLTNGADHSLYWYNSGCTFTAYGSGDIPIIEGLELIIDSADNNTFEYLNWNNTFDDIRAGGISIDGNVTGTTIQHFTCTLVQRYGTVFQGGDNSDTTCYNNNYIDGNYAILGHGSQHSEDTLIYACIFGAGTGGDRIQIHEGADWNDYLGPNHIIHNNIVRGSAVSDCVDLTSGTYITCRDNNLYGARNNEIFLHDVCNYCYLYRNWLHDHNSENSMLLLADPDIWVWGNLVDGTDYGGYGPGNSVMAFYGDNEHNTLKANMNVYKNTFIHNSQSHPPIHVSAPGSTNYHATNTVVLLKWNIISHNQSPAPSNLIEYEHPANFAWDDSRQEIDYNIWDGFGCISGATSVSWSTWRTPDGAFTGWDLHGKNTTIGFVDKAGQDFRLTEGSAARGMGPLTGTYNPDITENAEAPSGDGSGLTTQNDAGAYEYAASGNPPSVTNGSPSGETTSSFTAQGNITSTGDTSPSVRGFYISTQDDDDDYSHVIGISPVNESGVFGTGLYTLEITGLDPNRTYYFRAYATNASGTAVSANWDSATTSDVAQSCTLYMQSGDVFKISDGDDASDFTLSVPDGAEIQKSHADADITIGGGENLGTMGDAGDNGSVTAGVFSGCGDYVGDFSDLQPVVCGAQQQQQIDNDLVHRADNANAPTVGTVTDYPSQQIDGSNQP